MATVPTASGADDWQHLIENIRKGQALHDSLRDLAAKLICSGTKGGAALNQLRALMQAAEVPHDKRWQARFDDIPHLVDSAEAKFRQPDPEPVTLDSGTARDRWNTCGVRSLAAPA